MKQTLTLKSGNIIELEGDELTIISNMINYKFKILNNLNELQVFLKTCKILSDKKIDLLIKVKTNIIFIELKGYQMLECYIQEI